MLDFLFEQNFSSIVGFKSLIVGILVSLFLGIVICSTYRFTYKNKNAIDMQITLLILPSIIGTIILLVGNNIAGAFSLAGIFAVIKFRSIAGTSRDMLFILFCVAVGLSIGVKEYLVGIVLAFTLSAIMWLLKFIKFGYHENFDKILKLLMPEDENIEDVLHPILSEYAFHFELVKMTTKDLGSVFEVSYVLTMKDKSKCKELIDKVRVVNGNLKICLNTIVKKEYDSL